MNIRDYLWVSQNDPIKKKLAGTKCCACIFLDHNFTEIKSKIQNIYLIYLEITFIIIEKNVYLQML